MATTKKRLLSLVMAVVMAFSLLPISVLAANESDVKKQTTEQIVNKGGTSYYMANGSDGSASNYDVSVTKELTATGVENEFNVKVNVTYKNATTTTQSADAATTLIIDTSGSMDYCAECGNDSMEESYKWHQYCPDGSGKEYVRGEWVSTSKYNGYYACANCGKRERNHNSELVTTYECSDCGSTQSRIMAAQAAACAFLDSYASGAQAGTHRYVSLVTFAQSANSRDLDTQTSGKQYWVDVTDATALQRAKDVINGLSASGGTNTSGGVMLANNLFTQKSVNSQVAGIDNKFAVLLTDGQPTYRRDASSNDVGSISKDGGNGSETSSSNSRAVENTCKTLVNSTGVDLFAISYGLSGNIVNGSGTTKTITSWLQDDCYVGKRPADDPTNPNRSDVFLAGNSAALNSAFSSILNSIEQSGSTGEAAGDIVSGGAVETKDKCIGFVQFTSANGATQADGEIVWNLAGAAKDTTGVPEGYTSYTMTYKVRLDNTQDGFVEGQAYSTGAASFTYQDASTGNEYTKTSPAPIVKGYLGSLVFNKVSHHTVNGEQQKLPGAKFTLTSTTAAPSIIREASSSAEEGHKGEVLFDETIPSGYTYTMKEFPAPEGYVANDSEWAVTVNYGEVTITSVKGDDLSEGGSVVNKLAQTYKDLTLTKSWYMPANPQGGESTQPIYVNVYQDGGSEAFATLYLNGSTATVNNCADSNVRVAATQNTTTKYWEYTLTVPDNNPENGGSHTYTISEPTLNGFDQSGSGLALINTATGKTSIYVEKEWILPEGVELTLPRTVQVEVLRNGESFGDGGHTYLDVDSSKATGNTAASLELDLYDSNGEYYTYTVSEITASSYQLVGITGSGSAADPFVITNTVANETAPVTVSKTWQDAGDDSKRPAAISVQLLRDGAAYGSAVELKGESWSHEFGNLPKYSFLDKDGNDTTDLSKVASVKVHTYTVQELGDFDGYTSSANGLTLTNTRQENGAITVTKYWEDGITGGHTGSVVVRLNDGATYEDKTLNEGNGWTASWEGVPQYDATGNKITYTVSEVSGPANYVPVISYGENNESAEFVNGEASVTITNTPNGSEDTTSVTVNKTWNHPAGYTAPGATFTLYQAKEDGSEKVAYAYPADAECTNPAENVTGSYTFTNLPKYYFEQNAETGESVAVAYVYTVVESPVTNANGDAYTSSHAVEDGQDGSRTYNFVNTITGSVSVQVSKEWIDLLAGSDSSRAAQATIQLERSTDNANWETMAGKTVSTNVDKTFTPWSGLEKYDANGQLYIYRVTEQTVMGYETPVISDDLDNSANFAFEVTNKLAQSTTGAFTVTKNWVDGSAANADRPAITLTLKQGASAYGTVTVAGDGTVAVDEGGKLSADQVSANVNTTNNSWTVYFNGLDLYDIGASSVTAYVYSIEEASVEGYQSTTVNHENSNSALITNTLTQGVKDATVTKIWRDPTNNHPDVTFTLSAKTASGASVTTVGGAALPTTIVLTQDAAKANESDSDNIYLAEDADSNNWSYTVSGLPKYNDNRSEIFYTFDEPTAPAGYTKEALMKNGEVVPNAFVNIIEQEIIPVAGTKAWNRTVEGDYYVPGAVEGIYVALYRDDNQLVPESELAEGITNPLYVTKGDGDTDALWSFSFGDLEKYDVDGDGHEYSYSVSEVYYETVEGQQVLRKVENNGSIVYGTDTYKVTYGGNNAISNAYDQPQKYWYRVDTSYTTVQSGTTVFSYSAAGTVQEFEGPGTLSVDPADYAALNGIPFEYVSANTRAFIDVKDGEDTPLEFTGDVSVTVDQINRVYVIHLEYVRTLYKLTTNYYYEGTTNEVHPSTTDPGQLTGVVTDVKDYKDPGKYTATEAFTTERKQAPAGYEIVRVTLRNGTGEVQTVEVKDGSVTFPDGGNFNSADVTVTYYYDKITAEHQTVGAEVTFTKKGDSGETASSGSNSQIAANAVFGLYSDAACETLVKEISIGADGKLTITAGKGLATDLAEGSYYLKETAAPTGYVIGTETVYAIAVASSDTSYWSNNVWYPQTTWTITVDGGTAGNIDVVNNMLKETYSVEYYFETGVNSNTYTQKSEYPDKTDLVITYFDTIFSSDYELGKDGMGLVPDGYSLNEAKTGPKTLTYAMVTGDPAQKVIKLYYDLDMTQREDLSVTKSWIGEEKTATVGLYETVDGVETLSERTDAVKTIVSNATWSDLDEYTDGGKAITYAVYEIVANSDGTYTKVASGDTVTIDGVKYLVSYKDNSITNRELRSVTVTKAWSDSTPDAEKAEVSLQLYAGQTQVKSNALNMAVGDADGVITLNTTAGYSVTYSDLYATDEQGNRLTYSVKELDASGNPVEAGKRITLGGVNFIVSYSGTTVTNTKELGAIIVTKSFEGVSALGGDFLITVKNGTGASAETVALLSVDGRTVNGQQTMKPTSGDGKTAPYSWYITGLPTANTYYAAESGEEIANYTLQSGTLRSGSTTVDANKAIALKNIYLRDTVTMTITKDVTGDLSEQDFARNSFTFKVYEGGSLVKTVFLPKADNSTNSADWQEEFPVNTNTTYTVVEEGGSRDGFVLKVNGGEDTTAHRTLTKDVGTASVTASYTNDYDQRFVDHNQGSFRIEKKDAGNNNAAMAGVEFNLYTDADCKTLVQMGAGTSNKTDDEGKLTINIPESYLTGTEQTFYLKETVPAGYVDNGTVWTVKATKPADNAGEPAVKITLNDNKTFFDRVYTWLMGIEDSNWANGVLTVYNTMEEYTITVKKVDGTGAALKGAAFTLDTAALTADSTGTVFTSGKLSYSTESMTIAESTTPAGYDGITSDILVAYDVQNGKVAGLKAADGATLPTGVTIDGFTVTVKNTKRTVANLPVPASFSIHKVDSADATVANDLEGVGFTLYQADGETVYKAEEKTGATGLAAFTGLQTDGTYVLKETTALEGYTASSKTWTVTVSHTTSAEEVNGDNNWQSKDIYSVSVKLNDAEQLDAQKQMTVVNTRDTGKITVGKTSNFTGTYSIGVYTYDAEAETKYTLVDTAASLTINSEAQKPTADFAGLPTGTYYVKEADAGKLHHSLQTTYTVNGAAAAVNADGYVEVKVEKDAQIEVICDNQYTYVPNYTTISVEKVWSDDENRDGNRPDSVTVSIADKNGSNVVKELVITKNAEGKYTSEHRFDANGYTAPYTVTELGYTRGETFTAASDESFEYTISYLSGEGDAAKTDGTVVDGKITITNSYEPETLVIPVVKSWSGEYAGQNIKSVTLELYADGEPTGVVVELTADNAVEGVRGKWFGLFESNYNAETETGYTIYRNSEGKAITYSVKEIKLGDHTMTGNSWGYWSVTTGTSTANTALPEGWNTDLAEDALVLTVNNRYHVPSDPYDPEDPEDPPVEIPDDPTPGGDKPVIDEEPGEEPTEIEDEPTPTGPAPKTGDVSGIWVALASVSACGIAALSIFGKRKKEEDQ
ncbi:Cna B-type domain-containing protein [Oscillibacter sp. MSJ-2]|uniref:Cna B-type domain-containing protein n=1 Tax=Dysosmobacter acutus TaxID=2841504 RepID=A0ABS6FAN3_9FIRM|nr:Cna B-type domain-containing protein [Dysosmobacter acutus]MBU5626602.1 Cna B-type domain-containing protein [Dysosmobacter acutus]